MLSSSFLPSICFVCQNSLMLFNKMKRKSKSYMKKNQFLAGLRKLAKVLGHFSGKVSTYSDMDAVGCIQYIVKIRKNLKDDRDRLKSSRRKWIETG